MRTCLVTLIACSTPAAPHVAPGSAAPTAPAAPAAPAAPVAPDVPTAPTATTPPLDPSTLAFVDVPALKPPAGARAIIGLNVSTAEGALSPAGDVLAIAGGTNGVQLVHVPTGRGLATRPDLACIEPDRGFFGPCQPTMAFAPDGKRLAVRWPQGGKLVVLAVPSGKTELEAKVDSARALAFLDDGRLAVLGSDTSWVFDPAGTRRKLLDAKGVAMRISGDGRQILVDGDEVQILDVATGKVGAVPPGGGHLADVAFGPARWVAATQGEWADIVTWSAGDRAVQVLASSSEARRTAGGDGVSGFAFPPPYDQVFVAMSSALIGVGLDGKRRFRSEWLGGAGLGNGSVVRRDDQIIVRLGVCALRLDAQGQPVPGPLLCALRPALVGFDGDHVVSLPWGGGGVMTVDAKTGVLVSTRSLASRPATGRTLAAIAHDPELAARVARALTLPGVKAASYELSRDGKQLFINDNGRESAIVDLATKHVRTKMNPFVPSADGTRIAIQRDDRTDQIDVRTVDGDRLIRTLPVPTSLIESMAMSDDGRIFAASDARTTVVLDVATGRVLLEAPCGTSYTLRIELSPDGKLLVCDSTAVQVYDVGGKKLVKRFEHPDEERVDAFALSPDGHHLAIGMGTLLIVDL